MTKIQQIQQILGVVPDGLWGPKSKAALAVAILDSTEDQVVASSFADLRDVAAFKRCKMQGKSDTACFKVGDNGIGAAFRLTATEDFCICALPPEVWVPKFGPDFSKADGAPVEVVYKGLAVTGVLGDTMPHISNIHNGARIDLNPGFAKAFALRPPFLVPVTYRFL